MKYIAFLNSYSQGLSGGDACFLNVASALTKSKTDITIVTSELGKRLCLSRNIQARYFLTTTEEAFSSVWITYAKRIVKSLLVAQTKQPSVLYSSSDFLPDVIPAFLGKLTNPKNLWVQKIFHLIPSQRPLVKLLQQVSFLLIKNYSDLVIVDNQTLGDELSKSYGFPSRKVHFVPPGLDPEKINKTKARQNSYDAIFVGQLRPSKGIFDLVPIWQEVVRKFPLARLVIIGKDVNHNADTLARMVRSAHLEKQISIVGMLDKDEEVYAYMKSAKLLLLPSYEEGFGMVLAESLACGTQPVAYDLPVFRENFGNNVIVSPVGDVKKIASNVSKVLAIKKRESAKLKTSVQKFAKEAVVRKELELISHAFASLN